MENKTSETVLELHNLKLENQNLKKQNTFH